MINKKSASQSFPPLVALVLVISLLVAAPQASVRAAFGDRITISGTQFMAGGQRIWINGANTPWNNWNDFGGSYNASWWDNHFQQLHDAGVNATRVWITCSGEVGITISEAGFVSGATAKHWQDLDSFFQIAQQRQIYIMATLISFDHFKNTYSTYPRWRNMLNSNTNIDSYVNNYVIPFVNRYESNPYLWSIDLINEPDWVHENTEVGQFPWDPLQQYWARAARAIHENSPVLVTVGMGMPKYNSGSCNGCEGNVIADSTLRAKVNDPDVYIDFYSSHYYPWQDPYFNGIPFGQSPTAYYGFDPGKPSMIGETPANGSTGHTLTEDYENAYLNGWQGVMPWTSNGVDGNGGFAQLSPATTAFRNNHPNLVFPGGPTATATRTATGTTLTPTRTSTPTVTATGNVNPVYQAEAASFGGGATADSNNTGYFGTGFINFPATGGFLQFNNVEGGTGGNRTLRIRYALGASASRTGQFTVNGTSQNVTFTTTGSWTTWAIHQVTVPLNSGATNTIRFASTGQDLANIDQLEVALGGGPTNTPVTPTTPVVTNTPTRTPTPSRTPTGVTNTPTRTPTATQTQGPGACSPVTGTITAPFTQDGAGTFCWQATNLGNFINSWNVTSLTINGVDITNKYMPASSYPAKINGYWYISYTGNFPWSHVEVR